MGKPLVNEGSGRVGVPLEPDWPIVFLPSGSASSHRASPFVAIVRSPAELSRWLSEPSPGLQWLQVEGLLQDPDAWAPATHSTSTVPLDVVMANPASEFSDLYRLVDTFAVRDVRVSMPASPGFLKALKVAVALRLPVRLLPGQPSSEVPIELIEAINFYLRDPMVETPVEFFHSVLASMCGAGDGSLWMILEEDPALFLHREVDGGFNVRGVSSSPSPSILDPTVLAGLASEAAPKNLFSATFVDTWFKRLLGQDAECATCPWQQICQGYFKWPDPAYDCEGVKQLFSAIELVANEMGSELAGRDHIGPENELGKLGSIATS
ncbi:MAG TPA: hypothetical protein VIH58_12855 [Chthoniobacterales bacterium]|jgi:hypothetical protein